jgi:hypothetical protein
MGYSAMIGLTNGVNYEKAFFDPNERLLVVLREYHSWSYFNSSINTWISLCP